ncbi:hypothetical protein [Rhizobium sp. AN80A]|uniref:hypothetical protein n=1 Tax=Rhizobium sp. AN80A TaxID=3040673 RepID=UPI0024B359DE|nr:hypothetical protein [Rhizobium sp. AN80A]
MARPKAKKRTVKKKRVATEPVPPPSRPLEEVYLTFRQGLRAKTQGKRILSDTTADISKYADDREPQMPGTTIRNSFRAYPWRPTPFNTVKG